MDEEDTKFSLNEGESSPQVTAIRAVRKRAPYVHLALISKMKKYNLFYLLVYFLSFESRGRQIV